MINEQQGIKPYVIGLDLGGTNSVFGIVDARGEIKATTAIKTGGFATAEDYVDACIEVLQPIIEQVGGIEKIKSMGIGAPNANYYNGTIEKAPNLPWAHDVVVPLAQLFSERLSNIPVALTNDANAAALGEMVYGVARGMKNFIVITLTALRPRRLCRRTGSRHHGTRCRRPLLRLRTYRLSGSLLLCHGCSPHSPRAAFHHHPSLHSARHES